MLLKAMLSRLLVQVQFIDHNYVTFFIDAQLLCVAQRHFAPTLFDAQLHVVDASAHHFAPTLH